MGVLRSCRRVRPLSLVLACVLAAFSLVGPAMAQGTQRIAAIINNDVVSLQDLESRIDLAVIFSGLSGDAETRRRLAPQVLRRIIDEKLQLQETDRLGLRIGEAEVTSAIGRLAQPNGMTTEQLTSFLGNRGIDPERLRDQIRAELSWVRLVRSRLASRVVISEQQVDLALDAESEAGEREIRLSEILLPVYDPTRLTEVENQARGLMASIREGADFAALASQVSVGEGAERGGDLGWVPLASLAGGLRSAVAALGPGQLSDPVRSPAGVHLFLVRELRQGRSISSDPDARKLAQIFFPLPGSASAQSVELTRTQANGLRARLGSCDDVVAMADQLGAPASGDLGWLRPNELPRGSGAHHRRHALAGNQRGPSARARASI